MVRTVEPMAIRTIVASTVITAKVWNRRMRPPIGKVGSCILRRGRLTRVAGRLARSLCARRDDSSSGATA